MSLLLHFVLSYTSPSLSLSFSLECVRVCVCAVQMTVSYLRNAISIKYAKYSKSNLDRRPFCKRLPPLSLPTPHLPLLCLATAILLQKLAAKMPRYLNIYMEKQQQQQQERKHQQQQQQQNFVINNLHICFGNGKNSASFTLRIALHLPFLRFTFVFLLQLLLPLKALRSSIVSLQYPVLISLLHADGGRERD